MDSHEDENRPQDRPYHRKKPKPPTRVVKMQLPLDLVQALEEMAAQAPCPRTLHNMIVCSLTWAAWAHSHGRGPDAEMTADLHPDVPREHRRGYRKWNEKISGRREIRELERLYRLGNCDLTDGDAGEGGR